MREGGGEGGGRERGEERGSEIEEKRDGVIVRGESEEEGG